MAIAAALAVVGGVMQAGASRRARRANEAEQEKALAFQKQQMDLAKAALKKGNKAAFKNIMANQMKAQGDLTANLASKGIQEGSTMSLAAERGLSLDTSRLASDNERQLASALASIEIGAERPSVWQEGPTGNWGGDIAGAYLASQRYGSGGTPGISTKDQLRSQIALNDAIT
jgi:hypothetical protein